MRERPEDVAALQAVIDRSYAAAGRHLLSIHAPEHRATAEELVARLDGMRLLALATSTADGRPIVGPVDGILYRGAFHFGSATDSLRWRHLLARPHVSATHLPSEELAVTVHGRATPVDVGRGTELREVLLGIYVPRFGAAWEEILDSAGYARIDADRVFAFRMDADGEQPA